MAINGHTACKKTCIYRKISFYVFITQATALHAVWGAPVIHSPSELEMQEHQEVTLNCTTDTYPMFLIWNRDNVGFGPADFRNKPCKIDDSDPGSRQITDRYNITCAQEGTTYTTTLVIPAENVTEYEHNTMWQCSSLISSVFSNIINMYILVPVRSVTLSSSINATEIYLPAGKSSVLHCVTSASRPAATIDWFINDVNITSNSSFTISSNYSGPGDIHGPTRVTRSSLSMVWKEDRNQQLIFCRAYNGFSVASNVINILNAYGPIQSEKIQIIGYKEEHLIYEGENDIQIMCMQKGCNPLCTLKWSCGDLQPVYLSNSTHSISRITVHADRKYNQQKCTCTATHPDSIIGYSSNATVVISISYPPSKPNIQQIPDPPWIEDGNGTLKCLSTPGYPTALIYSWYQSSTLLQGYSSNEIILSNLSDADHKKEFVCRVDNNFTTYKETILTGNVVLNIQYSPIISIDQTNIKMNEGSKFSLQCHAEGNPLPLVYWSFKNEPIPGSSGGFIEIYSANRSNAGVYTCHAVAHIPGKGKLESHRNATVNVLYSVSPEPPYNTYVSKISQNYFNLRWHAGKNGGESQIFVIVIKDHAGVQLNVVQISEISSLKEYETTIRNLISKTRYNIALYAKNIIGNSSITFENIFNVYTFVEDSKQLSFGAGIATGVGSSILLTVIVLCNFYYFFKRKHCDKCRNDPVSRQTYDDILPKGDEKHTYRVR